MTVDGGNTWTLSTGFSPEHLRYVLLLDTLVGFTGTNRQTWRTSDGGLTWASVDSVGPFGCMYSTDSFHVWGVGTEYNPRLWQSNDRGLTWDIVTEDIPADYVMSVFFLDTLVGWVANFYNGVQRTIDGGKSWTQQSTPSQFEFEGLRDIEFADAEVGWVTGWGGQLYVTEDGGDTWSRCDVATQQFIYSISLVDRFNGWAVGWGGTILHLH